MKYTVRKSIVRLVGQIWMPSVVCGQTKELSSYDVGNIKQEAMWRVYGDDYQNPANPPVKITREDVEQWLMANSGDFQTVTDFEASIEDGDKMIDIPWASEDGEYAYIDAVSKGD
jgi:hypothetical protein